MKTNFSFIVFLCFAFSILSQDVDYLIREGELLEKAMKDEEAVKKYQEALKISPNDLKALVKTSEMNSIIGNRQKEKKRKRNIIMLPGHMQSLHLK